MERPVRIDEAILREIERLAIESRRSLEAVLEDLLREALARRLPVFRGNGLQPRVDLNDTGGLLDRMDTP